MSSMRQMRLFIGAGVAAVVAIFMGIGELGRCCRSLMGATDVTIAEVAANGLQSYSYVRITGVCPVMERSVIVSKINRRTKEEKGWRYAYVPLVDAAGDPEASSSVLAWLPRARKDDDLMPLALLEEEVCDGTSPGGVAVVGFVKNSYDRMDPQEQKEIAPLARVNSRNCWVVDVTPPSWFRGLAFTLGGLAIPVGFAIYKMKFPG